MEQAYIIEGMNENTVAFLETRCPQAGNKLTNELSCLVTGYRPGGIFDVNVDLPRSIRWPDDDNVEILIVTHRLVLIIWWLVKNIGQQVLCWKQNSLCRFKDHTVLSCRCRI